MSEYTFETAALKAVTIDAVKYNEEGLKNSLTPEAIQQVVPMAWSGDGTNPLTATTTGGNNVALGTTSHAQYNGTSVGAKSYSDYCSVAMGTNAKARSTAIAIGYDATAMNNMESAGIAIGVSATTGNINALAIGGASASKARNTIAFGGKFTESTDSGNVTHTCTTEGTGSITIGAGANTLNNGDAESSNSVTIGCKANTTAPDSITLGAGASNTNSGSIVIGSAAKSEGNKALTITLGSQFTETTDSGDVVYPCSTEGTGSITIGAGANTLNNGDVESSNSVTIGCKAENKGADSVVIGASGNATANGNVSVGTKSVSKGLAVAVGTNSSSFYTGTSIGAYANTNNGVSVGFTSSSTQKAIAIGAVTQAKGLYSIAIGQGATVSDYGATVIRSTAEDGTYTQLYFSGANTPLAKKYFPTAWEQKQDVDPDTNEPLFDDDGNPVMVDDPEKPIAGEAMMGFVAKDSAGNIIARGANMLSALFPYYTGEDDNPFQPTGMSLRGEKPEPVAFHPSDLDMVEEEVEVEEPGATEPNKPFVYKPLPVYPIVEPEIEEINE